MNRFLSRKFLLAVGALATLLANKQYTEAVALVLGYSGVNAYTEVKGGATTQPQDDAE